MNEQEINKWHGLILKKLAFPYFKPTNDVNDSGFQRFEIGYMTLKNKEMDEKYVIGYDCDVIHLFNHHIMKGFSPSIDVTKDGYIRLFGGIDFAIWDEETYSPYNIWFKKLEAKNDPRTDR